MNLIKLSMSSLNPTRLRHVMKVLPFVTLLVEIGIGGFSAGDTCHVDGFRNSNGMQLTVHSDKGQKRCCVTIECHEGTEAVMCNAFDPNTTTCVSCPPETHQKDKTKSFDMVKCERHTKCNKGSRVVRKGTSTMDTECACNLDLGYYGNWPDCFRDKSCPPGQQLMLNGSCESCPPNFHKTSYDSTPCLPCSVCETETQSVGKSCSESSDAVCGNKTFDGPSEVVSGEKNLLTTIIIPLVVVATFIVVVLLVVGIILYRRKNRIKNPGSIPSITTSTSSTLDHASATPEKEELIGKQDYPTEKRSLEHAVKCSAAADSVHLFPSTPHATCSLCSWKNCTCEHISFTGMDSPVANSFSTDRYSEPFDCGLQEDAYSCKVEVQCNSDSVYPEGPVRNTVLKGKNNACNGNVVIVKECQNFHIHLPNKVS